MWIPAGQRGRSVTWPSASAADDQGHVGALGQPGTGGRALGVDPAGAAVVAVGQVGAEPPDASRALATLTWSPTTPGTTVSPPLIPPETAITTLRPWRSRVPGAGAWRTTRPLGWALATLWTTTAKPAWRSRASASPWVRPTTLGTPTSGGAGGGGAAGKFSTGAPARAAVM